MNFSKLRNALNRTYSQEACVEILSETAICFREQVPMRWYLLLINRVFAQVIDNPEFFEADHVDPLELTGILCQSDREYISARSERWGRPSESAFAWI